MSGGVDSSVAAALLVEQGHRVVGLSLRLYDAPAGSEAAAGGRCCGPRDLEDARKVAATLGIPHYIVDQREAFAARVIDDFVAEYASGRTPNPCVRCNEHVKFQPLIARARALGAVALATGHYARLEDGRLWRGADAGKDQSYFLFAMTPGARAFARFPLGAMTKPEVRAVARRLGLPNADKPDSQEICFVPDGDHSRLVAARSGAAAPLAGDIVRRAADGSREVVGRHDGVHHYTIGQRRGLSVVAEQALYVVGLDAARREVVVGDATALAAQRFTVDDVRWLGAPPTGALTASVQVRSRHTPAPARVLPSDDGRAAMVELDAPERAIAPGQAAVFYRGTEVVGGGWIAARS